MAVGNVHGPLRWLRVDEGTLKTFRNKKDMDRFASGKSYIIKPDYDEDETGRTYKIINKPVPVAELSIPGVERGFVTTEQEFLNWYGRTFVGFDAPDINICRKCYMAGVESMQ